MLTLLKSRYYDTCTFILYKLFYWKMCSMLPIFQGCFIIHTMTPLMLSMHCFAALANDEEWLIYCFLVSTIQFILHTSIQFQCRGCKRTKSTMSDYCHVSKTVTFSSANKTEVPIPLTRLSEINVLLQPQGSMSLVSRTW